MKSIRSQTSQLYKIIVFPILNLYKTIYGFEMHISFNIPGSIYATKLGEALKFVYF